MACIRGEGTKTADSPHLAYLVPGAHVGNDLQDAPGRPPRPRARRDDAVVREAEAEARVVEHVLQEAQDLWCV